MALIGNPGLTRRHPLERHLRDVLCARVHTPQDDSTLSATGRAALATVTDQLSPAGMSEAAPSVRS